MQVYLHIGFPKTGSSAIQAHMMMNRNWLLSREFLFPESGHSAGYGHVHLFEDKTGERFGELNRELERIEAAGVNQAVISWEGVAQLGSRRLEEVASHLSGHDVTVIAYLREQSEIIQSGYFQAAKQRPQKRVMEDYRRSEKLVTPKHINYAHTLGKFEQAFGQQNIRVRLYERDRLIEGDIVQDFLDVLGLRQDDEFIKSPVAQNISLDPGSVLLLNIIDNYFDDPDGREKFVDSLLNDIQCNGAQGKYFLEREQVEFIRSHYREGNETVAKKYFEHSPDQLFSHAKPTYASDQSEYPDFGAAKIKRLHDLVTYRPWSGEALDGVKLQHVVSPAAGWAVAEPWGVWSDREESVIRFRLMRFRTNPFANWLVVRIKGNYFHDNVLTTVSAPGLDGVALSLEDAELKIPLSQLDDHARVEIRLGHNNPVSPHSLGQGDDERRLAFALKSLSFRVSD